MARLTITLSDERHRALKEAAVRRGMTLAQLIDESLEFYGIKPEGQIRAIVARARAAASLGENEAIALAVEEVREARSR